MMTKLTNEEEKREQITAQVDRSIFVEAGAGAGKTSLIISRLLKQLKQGISPENIVVITFTNKATEELQKRVIDEMKSAEEETKDETERNNLISARKNIEQLHISTIHSFCFKLIKENALEAALPVDIRMLEEPETIAELDALFEDWYATLDRNILDELYSLFAGSYRAKVYLKDAYQKITKYPAEVKAHQENTGDENYLQIIEEGNLLLGDLFEEIYMRLSDGNGLDRVSVFLDLIKENNLALNKPFREVFEASYRVKEDDLEVSEGAIWNITKLLKTMEKAFKANGQGYYPKEQAKSLNEDLTSANVYHKLDRFIKRYEPYCVDRLSALAQKAREYYRKHRDVRTVSNDLLLEYARDLLCENSELAKHLALKYRHIYIDEFQDVDRMQTEMARCFKENGSRLFLVGDPKQSIYRFRGADPKLFAKMKEDMIADPDSTVFELDDNYRSSAEVIDWINTAFKQSFPDGTYREMTSHNDKKEKSGSDGIGRLLNGVYKYDRDAGIPSHGEDAENVADLIERLVSCSYCIWDKEGRERPLAYEDFLVLTWDTRNMSAYTEAFKEKKIPFIMDGKEELIAYVVLNRFRLLYRYLARTYDKRYREGAIETLLQDDMGEEDKGKVIECLESWKEETKNLDGKGKAGFLLEKPEYLLPREQMLTEQEMFSVQSKLFQMVEKVCETARSGNEYLLAESFDQYVQTIMEHELVLEENVKAVRIMNMHKVKGLEAGVVILADRIMRPDRPEHIYLDSEGAEKTLYADYQYNQYGGILAGFSENQEKVAASNYERAQEEIRKQYVIATRAKRAMVIMDPIGKKKDYFSDYMATVEKSIVKLMKENGDMQEDAGTAGDPVHKYGQKKCFQKKRPIQETEQSRAVYISITPSGLEYEEKRKTWVQEEDLLIVEDSAVTEGENGVTGNEASEEENEITQDTVNQERPKGNIFGTVMHRCFELMMHQIMRPDEKEKRAEGKLQEIIDDDMITKIIRQAILENYSDIKRKYGEACDNPEYQQVILKYQEYLKEVLPGFLGNEGVRKYISQTGKYYTEYSFSFDTSKDDMPDLFEELAPYLEKKEIEIDDKQRVWVNGTVDLLLFLDDGRVIILDYKSDAKGNMSDEDFEKHLDKYNGQLKLYRHAVSRIFTVDRDKVAADLYHLYQYSE